MKKISFIIISILLAACAAQATPLAATPIDTVPVAENTLTPTATVIVPTVQPTFTLTPAPTPFTSKVSSADGMTQLFVPAGSVYMGGLDVLLENDELPAHHVKLDEFWIDQVEVTTGMYGLCVQANNCKLPTKLNSDNQADYFGNPKFKDYPVVQVTWFDANAYCTWAGRRLPTEAEWERAARGDDMRTYPWGNEPPNAQNSNSLNIVGDTSRAGSYAEGMSPFGVLDMGGNVWEWVADYYSGTYYEVSPDTNPQGPKNGGLNYYRVIRGGSYQDDQYELRVSNRGYEAGPNPSVLPDDPAYYGRSSVKIGFRCAE